MTVNNNPIEYNSYPQSNGEVENDIGFEYMRIREEESKINTDTSVKNRVNLIQDRIQKTKQNIVSNILSRKTFKINKTINETNSFINLKLSQINKTNLNKKDGKILKKKLDEIKDYLIRAEDAFYKTSNFKRRILKYLPNTKYHKEFTEMKQNMKEIESLIQELEFKISQYEIKNDTRTLQLPGKDEEEFVQKTELKKKTTFENQVRRELAGALQDKETLHNIIKSIVMPEINNETDSKTIDQLIEKQKEVISKGSNVEIEAQTLSILEQLKAESKQQPEIAFNQFVNQKLDALDQEIKKFKDITSPKVGKYALMDKKAIGYITNTQELTVTSTLEDILAGRKKESLTPEEKQAIVQDVLARLDPLIQSSRKELLENQAKLQLFYTLLDKTSSDFFKLLHDMAISPNKVDGRDNPDQLEEALAVVDGKEFQRKVYNLKTDIKKKIIATGKGKVSEEWLNDLVDTVDKAVDKQYSTCRRVIEKKVNSTSTQPKKISTLMDLWPIEKILTEGIYETFSAKLSMPDYIEKFAHEFLKKWAAS